MPRLKLTIAYMGAKFRGWQIQPGDRTAQGVIEEALTRIVGAPTRVHGAARTDSGVHAVGQVAHVDVPDSKMHVPWRKALSAVLPKDIAVVAAEVVPDDFHARFWAVEKTYAYHIWTDLEFVLPQRRPFVWRFGRMDWDAVDEAASLLTGSLDFAAFMNVGTPVRSTVRTLREIRRDPGPTPWEQVLRFTADGFLKQMVRNLVGCLAAVGKGKIGVDDVATVMAGRDRAKAPATAPAKGLTLERVVHGPGPIRANGADDTGDE